MALSYRLTTWLNAANARRVIRHVTGNDEAMEPSRAAELQALLVGVDLPAEKPALLAYAVQQRAEPPFIAALRGLPERQYESLDEVGEELVRVQPPRASAPPPLPHEESGAPPGGDAYLDPDPDTGQVRDLDEVDGG
jgi:hypothetical protein